MLAENFKTHVELGLPEEHRGALVLCLRYLESGKLRHVKRDFVIEWDQDPQKLDRVFNMHEWSVPTNCGTVCCIGGWAEYLSGVQDLDYSKALDPLFYPSAADNWDDITPEKAAIVVRHYLTTGEIDWSLVT